MNKPYVSMMQTGTCKICVLKKDLRCGVCFGCCDFVAGERISRDTHKLWDSRNPSNVWYHHEQGH